MEEKQTRQQQKANHVLFKQISSYCIENGIDIKDALEVIDRYEIAVTPEFVKSTWRAILTAQSGKESTAQQTKENVKEVEVEFAKLWSEITGQYFEWPSEEIKNFNETYLT